MLRNHMKSVDIQIGQISQSNSHRQQGGLPSDTVSTSKGKEQCNAMALRSGKLLQPPVENLKLNTGHFQSQDEEEEVEKVYNDPEPLENNDKSRKPSVGPEPSPTHQQVDNEKEREKADI